MFKKIDYKRLNFSELDQIDSHDIKRDEMKAFYLTFDFLDLIKKWPEIVGAKLALVTSPLKIRQDSLFIMTKHSSYSQELSFLSETIKVEVFKHFPNLRPIIKKLAFQTHESYFESKPRGEDVLLKGMSKLHPQSPQYKLLKIEAERLFKDIEDTELRSVLISLFIQAR
jgi:hypothetical protein